MKYFKLMKTSGNSSGASTARTQSSRRRSTDEGPSPRLTGDFNSKYLLSGQWPVPTLQNFNQLKRGLRASYTQWAEAREEIRRLTAALDEQTEDANYQDTRAALQDALALCEVLAKELAERAGQRGKGHTRTFSNLY